MYCGNCGKQIRNEEKFCPNCGQPVIVRQEKVQERKQEKKYKKDNRGRKINICLIGIIAVLVLVLVLQNLSVLPTLSGRNAYTAKDIGYDTPEKTAEAFTKAVAEGNVRKAVSFFACSQMADNYQFEKQIELIQVWMSSITFPYPSEETFFKEMNKEKARGQAASQIANICFSLQADEEYTKGDYIFLDDNEDMVDEIEEICDLEALDTLRIERMDYLEPDTQEEKSYDKRADIYGADEMEEYAILYEYDGDTFQGGMSFLRYGDKWYIQSLVVPALGQNVFGYLIPADEEEYLENIGIEK